MFAQVSSFKNNHVTISASLNVFLYVATHGTKLQKSSPQKIVFSQRMTAFQTMNIVKKTHLSNTHFPDVVNHLCLGKSKFARCSLNDAEVLIKEVRQFQVGLPLPAPIAIIISLINQPAKDLRILCKSKKYKN